MNFRTISLFTGGLVLNFLLSDCNKGLKQKGLVYANDFENMKGWAPMMNLTKYPAHEGVFASKLDSAHLFGPTLKLRFEDISPLPIRKLKFSMWIYLKSLNAQGKIVVAVEAPDKPNLFWDAKHIRDLVKEAGKWVQVTGEFNLYTGNINAPKNTIAFYPWSLSKEDFFVDDIRVEFVL
jgi:hypothetical protein